MNETKKAVMEDISDSVRNEFLSNMSKFASQISHAIQQVRYLCVFNTFY